MTSIQFLTLLWSGMGLYLCYRFRYYFERWRDQSWILKGLLFVLAFHTFGALILAVIAFS